MPAALLALLMPSISLVPLAHGQATTRPALTYDLDVENNPPRRIHVVTVDLANPTVHLHVSRGESDEDETPPWETTLVPVSVMAERDGLAAAINGNFFTPKDVVWMMGRRVPYFRGNWARACGWAMSDGVVFSHHPQDPDWPMLVVNSTGRVHIGRFPILPEDARQIVSGTAMLVISGKNVAPQTQPGPDGTPAQDYPRTGVGINRDGTVMWMIVVDGHRPKYSCGITYTGLADELIRRGAWTALSLDGGGSSTMVVRDADGTLSVKNKPSDGHDFVYDLALERPVADALGVVIDSQNADSGH